jgi:hypothetical protein
VDPLRGGSIREIESKNDSWLFFDPTRASTTSARYDDVWSGGFEELFPNDAPEELDGRALPDHGELWNAPFEVKARSETSIWLRRRCECVPAVLEKHITLDAALCRFTLRYLIRNSGSERLWFLFKLHPAMRVEAGDVILLPGGEVTPVDPSFSRMLAAAGCWPSCPGSDGRPVDLSVVPAPGQLQEFVYVSRLPDGWCGIRRTRTGESLMISYPVNVLPHCWLFMSYGGWRDYYTVVLEPCTNLPKDLPTARRRGTCAFLDPGSALEFDVTVEVRPPHDS